MTPTPVRAAGTWFAASAVARVAPSAVAAEPAADADVEFRINGEAFGKKAMMAALAECATYDPKVCPTA